MGLDVRSYTNTEFVEKSPREAECPYEGFEDKYKDEDDCYELVTTNPYFPVQSGVIVDNGVYKVSPSNVSDYPQWSYGGYNRFRNTLAKTVGYISADDCWRQVDEKGFDKLPLSLLIYFSDCEGCFDTSACKTISEELQDVSEDAFDDFGKRKLTLLKEVFKDAAENNGIVIWS